MIYIPFFFFLVLLLVVYRKNGFDLSCLMISIYAVSSLFSIIIYNSGKDYGHGNYSKMSITIESTLVYCFLIFLNICPFILYNTNKKRLLNLTINQKVFDNVVNFFFLIFIIALVVYITDIIKIIQYGDFAALRRAHNMGELSNVTTNYQGPLRFVFAIITIVGNGAAVMTLFLFYSITFLNKSKWYNIRILLGSLTPLILGFISIDRSKTIYWILIFVACYLFFKPYMHSTLRKKVVKFLAVLSSLLLVYIFVITFSRYEEGDISSNEGLVSYAGQSFINFSNTWEHYVVHSFDIRRIMPITAYFFGSASYEGDFYENNLELNVFMTYLGYVLRALGRLPVFIFSILYTILLVKMTTNRNKYKSFSLFNIIPIFSLSLVVVCGLFMYYYSSVGNAIVFWMFILLCPYLKSRTNEQ